MQDDTNNDKNREAQIKDDETNQELVENKSKDHRNFSDESNSQNSKEIVHESTNIQGGKAHDKYMNKHNHENNEILESISSKIKALSGINLVVDLDARPISKKARENQKHKRLEYHIKVTSPNRVIVQIPDDQLQTNQSCQGDNDGFSSVKKGKEGNK